MTQINSHNPNIDSILNDLYAIDPGLREHEVKLRTLISELIAARPDTKFDEAFAQRLRIDLMTTETAGKGADIRSPFMTGLTSFSWRKFQYGFAGTALALLLIIPITYQTGKNAVQNDALSDLVFKQEIKNNVKKNAFGTLNELPVNTNAVAGGMGGAPTDSTSSYMQPPQSTARNQGGVATEISPDSSVTSNSAGISTMMAPSTPSVEPMPGPSTKAGIDPSSRIMIAPEYTTYTYTGEPLELTETEAKVYQRVKGESAGRQLASVLGNSGLGLINLKKFDNLKARNIELAEDKQFGHSVYINFPDGTLSVSPNWSYWNMDNKEYTPMPISAVPSNDRLIAMADSFIKEYGIDKSIYQAPTIEQQSHVLYAADGSTSTIAPEQIVVIYPLLLDGVEVYDEGGMPYGLHVNIDIRNNRVAGLYNLNTQEYNSSSYTLSTDSQKVLDVATQKNQLQYFPADLRANLKERKMTLGTPKKILMRYFKYENSGRGVGQELYVPALAFPVNSPENESFYPKNILVPLVKDFLDQRTNSGGMGGGVPMPMPRPLIAE